MQLAALLDDLEVLSLRGPTDMDVRDVVADTRQVTRGALFCCVPGARSDGHEHAREAVERGAVALLVQRELGVGITEVQVDSTRRSMAPVAAAFHGHPSRSLAVIGVTGTNGKTTVTHLVAAALGGAAMPTGVLGTLSGERTTPEAPELQRSLARFVAEGKRAAAIEVSSHALDQHRVDATRFAVAVFTNLGRDHLDHHGSIERYFEAKRRLFQPDLAARAVVNLDDPFGRRLAEESAIPTTGFTLADAEGLEVGPSSSTFRWRGVSVQLPLLGRFNVPNALAALEAAVAAGADPPAAAAGLAGAQAVSGRMERVDDGSDPMVLVDYAHTPDGLAAVLGSMRELCTGRLVVVFGCGGDRDVAKRGEMGRVAAQLADVALITDDNPRSEDPAHIRAAVVGGAVGPADVREVPDRALAIEQALRDAVVGDVVVVAGKGHETEQVVGDERRHFDDREVARSVLARLREGAS